MPLYSQVPTLNFETIPVDAFGHILSYLHPEDVAHLALSRNLKERISQLNVWLPFLERLNSMSRNSDIIIGSFDSMHLKEQFISGFELIKSQQLEEITHFIELYKGGSSSLPNEMMEALLATMVEPPTNFNTLELRHKVLNQLNNHLISNIIDPDSPVLNIEQRLLTRFPDELFQAPILQDYWTSLKKINCSKNKLHNLPDSLWKCTALQELNCEENQLKMIPDTLGKCLALEKLSCYNNELLTLPVSIGQCRNLKEICCQNNYIQSLPDSLGNCIALVVLSCQNNRLFYLPESIGNCLALKLLACRNNHLKALPESLGNCVALRWLACGNNQLRYLPNSLEKCTILETLSFDNNLLQVLPDAIWRNIGSNACQLMLAKQNIPYTTPINTAKLLSNFERLRISETHSEIESDPDEAQENESNTYHHRKPR